MKTITQKPPPPSRADWARTQQNMDAYQAAFARRLQKLESLSPARRADLLRRLQPDQPTLFRWRFLSVLLPPRRWTPAQQGEAEANAVWYEKEEKS